MGFMAGYDERTDPDASAPPPERPSYDELLEANERLARKASRVGPLRARVTELTRENRELREALKRQQNAA